MTLIEFFDNDPIRNVGCALLYAPERVVVVGGQQGVVERHLERYRRVFAQRGQQVIFERKTVTDHTLQGYIDVLSDIIEMYDDLVFDANGGDRMMMIALGVVYERFRHKSMRLCQRDIRASDNDREILLTVEEWIRLYGGDIVYSDVNGEDTYLWDMHTEFVQDIERMWAYCRGNTKGWNKQIGVFEAAKSVGQTSKDGLTVSADLARVKSWIDQRGWKYRIYAETIRYLTDHGLITDFQLTPYTISITFKNAQVKRCLTKSGLIFELRVFSVIRSLRNKDGTPMYDDAVNGVVIDWDGVFHHEAQDGIYDTENEIDVLMTRGTTPIFVSCKSGWVVADELYKLYTVARRFGGEQAKMVLAVSTVDSEYLRQRIIDMGIRLVEGVHEMDDAALAQSLSGLWQS